MLTESEARYKRNTKILNIVDGGVATLSVLAAYNQGAAELAVAGLVAAGGVMAWSLVRRKKLNNMIHNREYQYQQQRVLEEKMRQKRQELERQRQEQAILTEEAAKAEERRKNSLKLSRESTISRANSVSNQNSDDYRRKKFYETDVEGIEPFGVGKWFDRRTGRFLTVWDLQIEEFKDRMNKRGR